MGRPANGMGIKATCL